jgi:sulfopyruvate decarboxylase TPP-binding subunit
MGNNSGKRKAMSSIKWMRIAFGSWLVAVAAGVVLMGKPLELIAGIGLGASILSMFSLLKGYMTARREEIMPRPV